MSEFAPLAAPPVPAPTPPIADLFAGLGAGPMETPDTPTAPAKQLLVGHEGRDRFKVWRNTPPDQAVSPDVVYPRVDKRIRGMLAATDMDTFLAGVRSDPDPNRDQLVRFWLHRYAEQTGDPDAAQFDIAKFVAAANSGVTDPKTSAAWRKIVGSDGVLSEEEGATLLESIRSLSDATAGLGPDLSVGTAGKVTAVVPRDAGAQVTVSRHRDATDELPVPPVGAVPAAVLADRLPPGEHQVVSPDGSVVPILKPDPDRAHRYRGWYPAIDGDDGLARWAPVRAQKVASVRSNVALEAARSGAAEVVQGDHWALDHEDSVVFTVTKGAKVPSGSQKLKRAVRIAPELRRERLTEATLDPELFVHEDQSPLYTHQWAVLPASEAVRRRLARDGHSPIEVEGDEPRVLVFGIDPEDAQAAVAPTRGGEVLVNEGRILRDGRLDPLQALTITPDGEYRVKAKGRTVGFSVEFAPDGELVTDRTPTSSVSTAVTKYRYQIPADQDPAEVAADLEARGATDLAVYARAEAAEGWQNASDELFSDGIETLSVRTAGYRPETPNSIPVWVRSTDGLESQPVGFDKQPGPGPIQDYGTFQVRQNSTDNGTVRPLAGRFAWQDGTMTPLPEGEADVVVRVRAGRAIVEVAGDAVDVVPALTARDSLTAAGIPAELRVLPV